MSASDQADRAEPGDLPPDPLLKSGSFICSIPGDFETLANGVKRRPSKPPSTESPEKGAAGMSNGKNHVNPTVTSENTASPVDLKTRKRPVTQESWLPPGWTMQDKVRTTGVKAGAIDKYYYDPSGRKFRSKTEVMYFLEHGTVSSKSKRTENSEPSDNKSAKKARAPLNFDFVKVPEKINWVLTNTLEESWTPFIGEKKVPESSSQDWAAAFTMVTSRNSVQTTF